MRQPLRRSSRRRRAVEVRLTARALSAPRIMSRSCAVAGSACPCSEPGLASTVAPSLHLEAIITALIPTGSPCESSQRHGISWYWRSASLA